MKQAVLKWTVPTVALLAVGPLAAAAVMSLHAADGSTAHSALLSTSPVLGLVGTTVSIALAVAVGVLAARTINLGYALFCVGLVLAWPAWMQGSAGKLFPLHADGAPMVYLAIEGVIIALVCIAGLAAILAASAGPTPRRDVLRAALTPQTLIGAGVGMVIGAIAMYVVAVEGTVGQVLAACAAAGCAAAIAARLAAPRSAAITPALSVLALSVLAPIATLIMYPGTPDLIRAATDGTLVPLGLAFGLTWVAGGFIGIPIGDSWSSWMIEETTAKKKPA